LRHIYVRAAAISILALGASQVFAVPTGPVATRTGARGFFNKPLEPTCTVCHQADLSGIPPGINDASGSIKLVNVPAHYVPGTIYTLTVQLQHDWNPVPADPLRWGFQLQAIQANTGDSSGTWVLTPNVAPDSFKIVKATGTSVYKNRRYVDQSGYPLIDQEHAGSPTHFGEVGPVEWHVKWQAPPGDSGKIYFFAAGNSTNGDDQCFQSGDFIFTTSESTTAEVNAAVGPGDDALRTRLGAPMPNPMQGRTDLTFSLARGGMVDLSIFDLSGRRVATLLHEFRPAGSHAAAWTGRNDRGERCVSSVYFVRLTSPDQRVITKKVVLDR
jgi:hypothetical protein